MLLPVSCPGCGRIGRAPCARCAAELRRAPVLPSPAGLDSCVAVLAYEGVGRELVARLKYRNHRDALGPLATAMAELVDPATVDVVTWAPTTSARKRQRGFDHGELLARAVATRLGLPVRRHLRRLDTTAQTGRALADRRRGPEFAPERRPAGRVLLVDDVVTSGATLAAAAEALRAAGCDTVRAVAAARTPPRATTGNP